MTDQKAKQSSRSENISLAHKLVAIDLGEGDDDGEIDRKLVNAVIGELNPDDALEVVQIADNITENRSCVLQGIAERRSGRAGMCN